MKYFYLFLCLASLIQLYSCQCPNQLKFMSTFDSAAFSGEWFVYQRSYTTGFDFLFKFSQIFLILI